MFCSKCGRQVSEDESFCSSCGAPLKNNNAPAGQAQPVYTPQAPYQQGYMAYQPQVPALIHQLRGKIQTEAIVWIVIASIQVIIALVNIGIGSSINSSYYSDGEGTANIVLGLMVLIVAVANFIFAAKDFSFAKRIMSNPVGIIQKYQPVGGIVGMLIWNFLMGGLVGIIGSIFCFVTRNFVIVNQAGFQVLETQYIAEHGSQPIQGKL